MRNKEPMFNQMILVLLAALVPCAALGQATPISVTITVKASNYQALGDAELEIRIANTSTQQVTIQTIDVDPPVAPLALNDRGEPVIVTKPAPKIGESRNREYLLDARETKSYKVRVRDLLRKGQELASPKPDVVTLSVVLPVVKNQDGAYQVNQVRSNAVKIEIDPSR